MGKDSFLSSPSLSCLLSFAHACTQIQKRDQMLSAWCSPFLLCSLLLHFPCFLRRNGQSFMGTVHLWVMKKQRGTDLLEKGCDIGVCLSILSLLFPLTLSCSLAFLVLFPWSVSVTLILSYPSTSRALKLPRIFLFDMSDSTSKIPENVQLFTSFSIAMTICLSEDLMENIPLQTRKIYLTFAKICPEKQN